LMFTPISAAVSASWKVRAPIALPSLVRMDEGTVARSDQNERRRRGRTGAARISIPAPITSGASGKGRGRSPWPRPPQSRQLGVLHHDPGRRSSPASRLSMSAPPRIGPQQGADLDQRAERSAPAITATTRAKKKLRPSAADHEIDGIGRRRPLELAMGEIHHPHDAEDQRQPRYRAEHRCRRAMTALRRCWRNWSTCPSCLPGRARRQKWSDVAAFSADSR